MASKEDIKKAALRLFAIHGYECTSMQDIAQAVGLKKQSLYSHFICKQELYEVVVCEQSKTIMSELHNAVDHLENGPTEALLKGLFKCLVEVFSCKERLLLWKRGFMIQSDNEALAITDRPDWYFDRRLWDRVYNIVRIKHAKVSWPESFRLFFISYVLSIQGYFDWMIVKGHSEEIFESFWNSIWNGIHDLVD